MPEVLKKFLCPMYGHHWGPKSKNVKKKGLFSGGLGVCQGKLEWFKCYFCVIFE